MLSITFTYNHEDATLDGVEFNYDSTRTPAELAAFILSSITSGKINQEIVTSLLAKIPQELALPIIVHWNKIIQDVDDTYFTKPVIGANRTSTQKKRAK